MNSGRNFFISAVVLLCFGIFCLQSASAQTFSGRAVAIDAAFNLNGSASTAVFADTGNLPPSGGNLSAVAPSSFVSGIMTTGVLASNTSGVLKSSQSSSTVNDLDVVLSGGVRIRANRVIANATCICCPGSAEAGCVGGTQVNALTITDAAGVTTTVNVTGQANQVVNLPSGIGTITINEQTNSFETISVNGLHIVAASNGNNYDIRVASVTTHIACSVALPTPAMVFVSGHVYSSSGEPLSRIVVTISDTSGNVRETATDGNGAYSFADVEAGHSYAIQAKAKGYAFDPVVLDVNDNVSVDIRATRN